MINVVAFPWHNCTEECDVSVSSRLVSGGAEEAGMKGWRGRSRIPPEGAKARFTRVSRGLAPQVSTQKGLVCLRLMDASGTAWLDDVQITEIK